MSFVKVGDITKDSPEQSFNSDHVGDKGAAKVLILDQPGAF